MPAVAAEKFEVEKTDAEWRAQLTPQQYEILRNRGTEDEVTIHRRLAGARKELAHEKEYQYTVINDDLETAVAELRGIVRKQFERGSHAG